MGELSHDDIETFQMEKNSELIYAMECIRSLMQK